MMQVADYKAHSAKYSLEKVHYCIDSLPHHIAVDFPCLSLKANESASYWQLIAATLLYEWLMIVYDL